VLATLIILLLMILVVSCSNDERIQLVEDNYTDSEPIASVAVIEQDPNIEEGNNLFLQGEFAQAIEKYENGLKANRSVAFYNIGVSYYLLGDIDKSEEYFRKAIVEDPNFKEAYINLSVILLQKGQLDEAEKYMVDLLKDSATGKLLVNMANIHLKRGETAKATVLYEQALKQDGNSRFVQSNYAYFLLSIGEFESGIKLVEQLDFKNYTDYYNLGSAYFRYGDYYSAISNLILAQQFEETPEIFDLLALSYNRLNSYSEEAEALAKLVEMAPSVDNRYRYALALFKSASYLPAHNVMAKLIEELPSRADFYITDYNILLAMEEYRQAGELINKGFKAVNTDALMYIYAKHMLTYELKPEEVRKLVFGRPESPYVNLARAMYHIYAGSMIPAQKLLDVVPPSVDNDYYVYRAYIMMKYRNYAEALKVTDLIDSFKPEYFWYKTVNLWNLKRITELKVHINDALTRNLRISRHPNIKMQLEPVLEDMSFSYRFDGEFEDILSTVLYPLLIQPDEMLNFVALGYRLLKQNDKLQALEELQKSVRFSEGIAHNNKGVQLFLAYAYHDALREFTQANHYLGNNPYTLYNMGLVHLALGNPDQAEKFFDNSIIHNRYNFPAYLGRAASLKGKGDKTSAYLEYSRVRDLAEEAKGDREKVPNIIYYTKYLADMGVGDYSSVINEISKLKKDDGFLDIMLSIAQYLEGHGYEKLETLKNSKVFRAQTLYELAGMTQDRVPTQSITTAPDRFYKFMNAYIQIKKNRKLVGMNEEAYMSDKVALKEFVYYNIYMRDSVRALFYLQQLSSTDFRYPELYKASLYYFMWLSDFVNAEASYSALENLAYKDKYFDYYKMLYFLLNYNEERLTKVVDQYVSRYQGDYRGLAIRMLISMKNDNIKSMSTELGNLESVHGNFLLKLPVELEIDGL
jgi:tetratricopeptide (TPR) repeat protein